MDHQHHIINEYKVFSGNANLPLALSICKILGVELGQADVGKFANGETSVIIHENIRAKDVYVIQSICAVGALTVSDALMELLVMADAFKVIVAPSVGRVKRAKMMADKLGAKLVMMHKEVHENGKKIALVGDVSGKVALIIGDIADTCESLQLASRELAANGAKQVIALVSHGLLSGDAIQRINAEASLSQLVITNSISNDHNLGLSNKIKIVNIAPMLAEVIRRIHHGESLDVIYD